MNANWMERLKAGYESGYYKTEEAPGNQQSFPWQNKRCRHCPFWLNGVCRVQGQQRSAEAHTCSYFDPGNHAAAKELIQNRMESVRRAWWDGLGRQ